MALEDEEDYGTEVAQRGHHGSHSNKSEKTNTSDLSRQSKIEESVSEDIVQYLVTLDEIVNNVYEDMDETEWKGLNWRLSRYYPVDKEDPAYGEKVRVYRMKLKEMRKMWTPPKAKADSSSSESTEEDPIENKGGIDVDVYNLSDSNSDEGVYKGSDNESGHRDS
eukprot:CAMPEP_0201881146 /NCGR_PEP_ID=MMETSP0902-20130614/11532_1 /ASSEMBLY_ACC=CAM_ASM_000551 /TAXON_ID=420261 /ORGANISM="Thalassiosira antarctica, Strain CCMP982" /LENGTH=164 /DNA_ID=CAMNT_0048409285 /DNA_START=1268 /DNA_END=1763 /DNA_ORIENTATION=+